MSEMTDYAAVFVHRFPMAVRWGDMDAYGHVNNVNFLRYFESGRVAYAQEAYDRPVGANGENVILADTQCSFKRQLHYPGDITILSRTFRVGRTSMTMEQIIVQGEGELVATSRSVMVWFDFKSQRPVPVPDSLKSCLRRYEAALPEGL
ncbi:MAG: thioesterase family protein [Pseudomonadota bacterium]|nr:thioesterase family protein [Pseudomonadota bacterium]